MLEEINQTLASQSNNALDVFKCIPPIQTTQFSEERTEIKAPDLFKLREEKTKAKRREIKENREAREKRQLC